MQNELSPELTGSLACTATKRVTAPPPRLADDAPPTVPRMRGPALVLVWLALAAAAWAVFGGVVYGLYRLVSGGFG